MNVKSLKGAFAQIMLAVPFKWIAKTFPIVDNNYWFTISIENLAKKYTHF